MNVQTAMAHLAAYREGKVTDPRLSKALRCIENESARRGDLAEQVAFDLSVMEMLGAIHSPPDLKQRLVSANVTIGKALPRPRHHLTAVLAVGLGATVIIAVLIFFQLESRKNFPGRESLVRIASAAYNVGGADLEPVANSAGELEDWFYMRGFEGYRLPKELRNVAAVGSRLFKVDGHPVAQIAIDPHQSLVYVMRGQDFGLSLPSQHDWTVFAENDWVAAARPYETSVAMITFRGSEPEMREFLNTLKP